MLGLKEAGVVGATAVLAGGVAYVVWVYASSFREKRAKNQPEEGGERATKEGLSEEGRRDKAQVNAVAAAPKTSAVRRRPEEKEKRHTGFCYHLERAEVKD